MRASRVTINRTANGDLLDGPHKLFNIAVSTTYACGFKYIYLCNETGR